MKPSENLKIVIGGGGLVGSLLGILLGRRGFKVEIFEKRSDMRQASIGAGRSINLALANRGIAPLIRAGVMDDVRQMILPMEGRMIHDLKGEARFQAYGQKPDEVIYSVSRLDLNKLLITKAEETGNVTFRFDREVTDVNGNDKFFLSRSRDGGMSRVDFDLLIGTDGAGSQVREAVLSQKGSVENKMPLDHGYKELQIPAGPRGEFVLDPKALHIWPRGEFMMIALPNPDKTFTGTLFFPQKGEVSFEALITENKVEAFFKEVFPDIKDLVPDLAKSFLNSPTGQLGTIKCFPWSLENSVLLMGDAAHAIVPFQGQGMNCGFEDCGAFDELLQKEINLESLFQKFEEFRKPNADAIADLALENYIEMRSKVIDPRFIIKKKMEFQLENLFPEVFIPRYSRVMFHHTPYKDAKALGEIQDDILEQLFDDFVKLDKIPFEKAKQLVLTKLSK
jgi:kynurenine 3-monooxygenase